MAAKKPVHRQSIKATVVKLSRKNRESFTENLALLLKAGVPLSEALESLRTNVKSPSYEKVILKMRQNIDSGYTLSQTMEKAKIVTAQTIALVKLGEASGNLVENLGIAADQEQRHEALMSKVRSALIYPIFVITLTVVIGLAISWFLLPQLADTFTQLRVSLPWISQLFIDFGLFLQAHGLIVVPSIQQ